MFSDFKTAEPVTILGAIRTVALEAGLPYQRNADLARLLGVSKPAIGLWLKGLRGMSQERRDRAAEVFLRLYSQAKELELKENVER